jgi:hypothetical protein
LWKEALLKFGPIPNCPQEGYELAGTVRACVCVGGRHNSGQTKREKPLEKKEKKRRIVASFWRKKEL